MSGTDLSQALKTRLGMTSDSEFIQYLEHLESARTNRPLHQLSENTDALLMEALAHRGYVFVGLAPTTTLNYTTSNELTITGSATVNLRFPSILGDGTTVSPINTLTLPALGALTADNWVSFEIDRAGAVPVTNVTLHTSTSNFITYLEADVGRAIDTYPLAHTEVFGGTVRAFIFGLQQWMSPGEALREGLSEYISQLDADAVEAVQVNNLNCFMTGGINGGNLTLFSWDAGSLTLSWSGSWFVQSNIDLAHADGKFLNEVTTGSIVLGALTQGRCAYVTLDRTADTYATPGDITVTVAEAEGIGLAADPAAHRNTFVFATYGDDGRIYLADGTVVNEGADVALGGAPPGVAWYAYGAGGGPNPYDIPAFGAILPAASTGEYAYGGHHIMVYINGILAKRGGVAGDVTDGSRYIEIDDGSGLGSTIQWLTGTVTGSGVPISLPTASDYIEIFLPMGSGAGSPGRWQAFQILQLSGVQTGVPAVAITGTGVQTGALNAVAADPTFYGIADHVGVEMVITHDLVATGDIQTSTALGTGLFNSSGGVDDGASSYGIDGSISLTFTGGARVVTDITYRYLKEETTWEYQVEGFTDNLPVYGEGLSNYYKAHPGSDKTTFFMDVSGGTLNGIPGARSITAGTGVDVSVSAPNVTVAVDDRVLYLASAGNEAALSASLDASVTSPLPGGAPSGSNKMVTQFSAAVMSSAAVKDGFEGADRAGALAGIDPVLSLEALRSILRTEGVVTYVEPVNTDETTSVFVTLAPYGRVLCPVGVPSNVSLHILEVTATVAKDVNIAYHDEPFPHANNGEFVWVYALEADVEASTMYHAPGTADEWLHISLNGPIYGTGTMVHPNWTLTRTSGPDKAAVPVACLLASGPTTLHAPQVFDYDRGILELPEPLVYTSAIIDAVSGSITAVLADPDPGYAGYASSSPLVPELSNAQVYTKAITFRVTASDSDGSGELELRFYSGDYNNTSSGVMTTVRFLSDTTTDRSQVVRVALPPTSANGHGDLSMHCAHISGSWIVKIYVQSIEFLPGFSRSDR